jgi:hypothetical protein
MCDTHSLYKPKSDRLRRLLVASFSYVQRHVTTIDRKKVLVLFFWGALKCQKFVKYLHATCDSDDGSSFSFFVCLRELNLSHHPHPIKALAPIAHVRGKPENVFFL